MRLASLFCFLIALAGISAAQDTNFPVGPQYLITGDSPMFLHPIATPTLSLSTRDRWHQSRNKCRARNAGGIARCPHLTRPHSRLLGRPGNESENERH